MMTGIAMRKMEVTNGDRQTERQLLCNALHMCIGHQERIETRTYHNTSTPKNFGLV